MPESERWLLDWWCRPRLRGGAADLQGRGRMMKQGPPQLAGASIADHPACREHGVVLAAPCHALAPAHNPCLLSSACLLFAHKRTESSLNRLSRAGSSDGAGTHHHAYRDHCVVLAALCHGLGHHRQLKGSRDPGHLVRQGRPGRPVVRSSVWERHGSDSRSGGSSAQSVPSARCSVLQRNRDAAGGSNQPECGHAGAPPGKPPRQHRPNWSPCPRSHPHPLPPRRAAQTRPRSPPAAAW